MVLQNKAKLTGIACQTGISIFERPMPISISKEHYQGVTSEGLWPVYILHFWKGKGTKAFSPLVQGNLRGNRKFLLEHFKGTKAMTRGHGGNHLRCLHEESGLRTKLDLEPTTKIGQIATTLNWLNLCTACLVMPWMLPNISLVETVTQDRPPSASPILSKTPQKQVSS